MGDVIEPDDRALLEFEDTHPGSADAKYSIIRARFDLSPTQYVSRMHRLIDRPEVEAEYPLLVHRAQRIRRRQSAMRAARRIG